jgi:hypothetical protein
MNDAPVAPPPAENRARGTLFALPIVPAGIVAWSLVSAVGFIAGWIAIAIALGALWLYRKGSGGRIGVNGAVRVSIITVVTLVLAFFAGLIASDLFGAPPQTADGDLVISIVLSAIFATLGIFVVFRTAVVHRALPPPA